MQAKKHHWASLILPLLILCFCIEGCGNNDSDKKQPIKPKRQVVVVAARTESIAQVLQLTGTLAATQEVQITSKIPGRVEKVLVEESSRVKTGSILIELEREELALAVAQAEAAVSTAETGLARVLAGTRKEQIEQAKAAVAQARANMDICKITLKRMTALLREKSIPTTKYDEAKARHDVALAMHKTALAQLEMAKTGPTREDITIAKAQVNQANASLASAKRHYQNATITSPINGLVAHRNVEPGEVVSPPMIPGKALLRIVDTSALKTRIHISENRVKAVELGQDTIILLDGFPNETFPGKISKISPVVNPQSRTFEAEVKLPNPGGRLKPGMFARVRLILAKKTNVVTIPLKAVCEGENSPVVFVPIKRKAEARLVTLGISDGIDVEIISGVSAGEMVIVRGNLGIEDGDAITLKTSQKNQ